MITPSVRCEFPSRHRCVCTAPAFTSSVSENNESMRIMRTFDALSPATNRKVRAVRVSRIIMRNAWAKHHDDAMWSTRARRAFHSRSLTLILFSFVPLVPTSRLQSCRMIGNAMRFGVNAIVFRCMGVWWWSESAWKCMRLHLHTGNEVCLMFR